MDCRYTRTHTCGGYILNFINILYITKKNYNNKSRRGVYVVVSPFEATGATATGAITAVTVIAAVVRAVTTAAVVSAAAAIIIIIVVAAAVVIVVAIAAVVNAAAAIVSAAPIDAAAAHTPTLPLTSPLSALCSPSLLSVVLHHNTCKTKLAFNIVYKDSPFSMEIKQPEKNSELTYFVWTGGGESEEARMNARLAQLASQCDITITGTGTGF